MDELEHLMYSPYHTIVHLGNPSHPLSLHYMIHLRSKLPTQLKGDHDKLSRLDLRTSHHIFILQRSLKIGNLLSSLGN